MKQKLIYGAVIVVVVAAVLGVWSMRGSPNNANFPQGTDWLCTNSACGNHYKMTVAELGEHHKKNYGQRPACPKCGKPAVRAEVCGHCGKVYPQNRGMQVCPYCGKEQIAKPAA